MKYSCRNDITDNVEDVFDFNESNGGYSDLNMVLSAYYRFINERSTPSFGMSFSGEKLNINVGAGYVFRTL
jgi:hypothetical protein